MSEIVKTKISNIDRNPLRGAQIYFNERKIEALRRSIHDVGLWEGVIARKVNGRCEIAFGHHRVEAARRELGENSAIPLIIKSLSEEDMLAYLGRENLEDYNADFNVMLQTWEAGRRFCGASGAVCQDTDIAKKLGWIRLQKNGRGGTEFRMNETAQACAAAFKLIEGKRIKPDQLTGLTVKNVREICQEQASTHEEIDRHAQRAGTAEKEIKQAKELVDEAVNEVIKKTADGSLAVKEIRGRIRERTREKIARRKPRRAARPLFSVHAKKLLRKLDNVLRSDELEDGLVNIIKVAKHIELREELELIDKLAESCAKLAGRAKAFSHRIKNADKPTLKELTHG
jgi:ParB-like chromosome segregation protein Spo0J